MESENSTISKTINKELEPYLNKIHNMDCLELMAKLPDNCIDLILTDPPWFISQEVIIHRSINPKKYKYVGKDINLDFGTWDHFESEEEYWKYIKIRFKECFRILKTGGHFISFFDQNKMSHLVDFGRENNMHMRQHLYWLKTNPVPRARMVDFMVALEQAVWFTKETKSKATFHYELGQQKNYIKTSIPGHTTKIDGERIHPTQKPVKLGLIWFRYLSNEGDVVFDPFAGSGAFLLAAQETGRNWFGCENKEVYCKKANERIERFKQQLKLEI